MNTVAQKHLRRAFLICHRLNLAPPPIEQCEKSLQKARLISTTAQVSSKFDPKLFVEPITDPKELEKPLSPDDPRNFLHPKPPPTFAAPVFYRNAVVDKFIRMIMIEGRKELATSIVRGALELTKRLQLRKWHEAKDEKERTEIELDPYKLAEKAMYNFRPVMRLQKMIKGGSEYQVPFPLSEKESEFRAMQMLRTVIREKAKGGKMMGYQVLAHEFISGAKNEGATIQAKQELHKACEANRAYAHYRVARKL